MKNHDVIRYQISGSNWCRHGLAVVHEFEGRLRAKDTYWGVWDTDIHGWLRQEEIETGIVIGNIDEFGPVSTWVDHEDYADEDKFYIPDGGCSAQTWIRHNAQPKPELTYKRLKDELENAEQEVQSALWKLENQKRLLSEHISQHGEFVQQMDEEAKCQ